MISKLQIHVYSGNDDKGDFYSHAAVIAEENDNRVRSSMIHSGSQAAASMSNGHARELAKITTAGMALHHRNQKMIGE